MNYELLGVFIVVVISMTQIIPFCLAVKELALDLFNFLNKFWR